MTTEATAPASGVPADQAHTDLWVERTGTRRYTGRSSRGAEVLIGSQDVEGVFTPGELLKIALAACTGMSSDRPLARRLGDDYDATIRVSGDADRENEVYPRLREVLDVDLDLHEPKGGLPSQRAPQPMLDASVESTVLLDTACRGTPRLNHTGFVQGFRAVKQA